jgi:type VI secretion system activator RovC-like protein/transcriptional regulator
VQAEGQSGFDWRDGAAYAPLLSADRSLVAWEWLRRDRDYRAAAEAALEAAPGDRRGDPKAAAFGLVAFEHSSHAVPRARPLWRSGVHPLVLRVERGDDSRAEDEFDLGRMSDIATLTADEHGEHLLLSDGLRAIRLDGPRGAFSAGPASLRYLVEGIVAAEPHLLSLRRFLALCRVGHFSRLLHPSEPRARRWILMLRAWDGLASGADQREIARELLSRSVSEPRWRSRESSVRSQAQRLVRSARAFAWGGYRTLLAGPRCDADPVPPSHS